jgi:hypothetical protein
MMQATDRRRYRVLLGLVVGIAAAAHPSSGLLVFGLVIACLQLRLSLRDDIVAALIAVGVFAICQLYFPIRAGAAPALNLAGKFSADGVFQPVDLHSLSGLLWMLRGGQFTGLFFKTGLLPSPDEFADLIALFWNNFLGVGLLIGLFGLVLAARRRAGWIVAWAAAFLVYSLFYANYNVGDHDLMFGPALLLWTFPLALGLERAIQRAPSRLRAAVLIVIPLAVFVANFTLIDLSGDWSVRTRAEATSTLLPDNALVFGDWQTIVPLQYLQMVEGKRPDLRLYNVFLFDEMGLSQYLDHSLSLHQPVIFLSDLKPDKFAQTLLLSRARYQAAPLHIPQADTSGSTLVGYALTANR